MANYPGPKRPAASTIWPTCRNAFVFPGATATGKPKGLSRTASQSAKMLENAIAAAVTGQIPRGIATINFALWGFGLTMLF